MDAELAARLEETRYRVELVADWMDREAHLVTDRVKIVAERLQRLERDLGADRLRRRRALGAG